MRPQPSRHRYIAGATGLAAYVFAAIVAPVVHIASEHRVRAPVTNVDPDRFRDSHGNIDLAGLASALGLGEPEQQTNGHTHQPGTPPHEHQDPLAHGRGATEHFGVALLSPSAVVIIPLTDAPPPPPPLGTELQAPVLPRWELDSAWPQGPPA